MTGWDLLELVVRALMMAGGAALMYLSIIWKGLE